MYVEPWIFWLILAPIAAVSAIYVGYLAMLLLGLLSISISIGLNMASEGMRAFVGGLASWYARGLSFLVSPFKHHGPWLDYAVMAILLIALSLGSVLWLAA